MPSTTHLISDPQALPVWEQIATDNQGRRRFHGAFTGGFSAGYFNTVGSEKGWEPQAFSSSRSNRSRVQQVRLWLDLYLSRQILPYYRTIPQDRLLITFLAKPGRPRAMRQEAAVIQCFYVLASQRVEDFYDEDELEESRRTTLATKVRAGHRCYG